MIPKIQCMLSKPSVLRKMYLFSVLSTILTYNFYKLAKRKKNPSNLLEQILNWISLFPGLQPLHIIVYFTCQPITDIEFKVFIITSITLEMNHNFTSVKKDKESCLQPFLFFISINKLSVTHIPFPGSTERTRKGGERTEIHVIPRIH